MNKKKLYSGLVVLIAVIFAGVYWGVPETDIPTISLDKVSKPTENYAPKEVLVSEKESEVFVPVVSEVFKLTAGDISLSLPVTNNSLSSILSIAKGQGEITFSGKEYSGLGFFVTEIGSLKEGNGKHLMYHINGKEASVGVSVYVPKSGDAIVWELK